MTKFLFFYILLIYSFTLSSCNNTIPSNEKPQGDVKITSNSNLPNYLLRRDILSIMEDTLAAKSFDSLLVILDKKNISFQCFLTRYLELDASCFKIAKKSFQDSTDNKNFRKRRLILSEKIIQPYQNNIGVNDYWINFLLKQYIYNKPLKIFLKIHTCSKN